MTYRQNELEGLLAHPHRDIRTLALTLLCDGYCSSVTMMQGMFASWDQWGVGQAFQDLPMLSYLPAESTLIEETCQRAQQMVQGHKLVDPSSRVAGKLIEQQMQLPAQHLGVHLELLRQTVATSKIFFRVNLDLLQQRTELLDVEPDFLAERLDDALAKLHNTPSDEGPRIQALLILEALRRQHPDYVDLAMVLAEAPGDRDRRWGGFSVTLQSLVQLPQAGLAAAIGRHLCDQREFVYSLAVEALVRCGSAEAGHALIDAFPTVGLRTQYWIARGLQRLRQRGLTSQIGQLEADEPHLRNSLATAVLCQLEPGAAEFAQEIVSADGFTPAQLSLIQLNRFLSR